jgi:hypothetical protein
MQTQQYVQDVRRRDLLRPAWRRASALSTWPLPSPADATGGLKRGTQARWYPARARV